MRGQRYHNHLHSVFDHGQRRGIRAHWRSNWQLCSWRGAEVTGDDGRHGRFAGDAVIRADGMDVLAERIGVELYAFSSGMNAPF